MRHAILFVLLAGSALACKGASSPTGECMSYSCDEEGAKAMMWATINEAYEPSESAKASFEEVIATGVKRMSIGGYTPDSFDLVHGNLKKFLNEIPEGGQDPLGPEAANLKNKTSKLCPLFPFC